MESKANYIPETELAIIKNINEYCLTGEDLEKRDIFGNTLLSAALEKGYFHSAKHLIRLGVNRDITNLEGKHIIMYALASKDNELIDLFLGDAYLPRLPEEVLNKTFQNLCYGCSSTSVGEDISRVLHFIDTAQLDLNTLLLDEEPFIFFAVQLNSPALVKIYLDRGGSLLVRNSEGISLLSFTNICILKARRNNWITVLPYLLEIKKLFE